MKGLGMIRAIVTATEAAAAKLMRFTGTGRPGESFSNREFFQHYGFASRPLEGAEAVVLRQGNQLIIVADDDRRYRIALEKGEVALFTDEGTKVHLMRGKKVVVDGADEISLGGERVTLRQLIDERFEQLFNAHTHPGVAAGSSSTGPPTQQLDLAQHATDTVRAK